MGVGDCMGVGECWARRHLAQLLDGCGGVTLNQSRKGTVALQGGAAAVYASYCTSL